MKTFTAVPFTTESESGLLSSIGVAKFSSAGIVLEFEKKIFGLIPRGVREIRLSLADILDVKFRKGILRFGAKIEIRTNSIEGLIEMPNQNGRVILRVLRRDFEQACDAVARICQNMNGSYKELPSRHSPISVLFDESEDETRKLKN